VSGAALLIVAAALAQAVGLAPLAHVLQPVTTALGVDQDWRVFAPNPRRTGLRVELQVEWSDGSRSVWSPPHGEPLLGSYRDYRWRKWMENATSDARAAWLLPPAARYVARRTPAQPGARPIRLRAVRYVKPLAPPGEPQPAHWLPSELYRADLTGAGR
jgi:hypothetical protein